MSFSTSLRWTAIRLLLFGVSASGGGDGMRPGATGPGPLPLSPGHGLTPGQIFVGPGESMEHVGVRFCTPALGN